MKRIAFLVLLQIITVGAFSQTIENADITVIRSNKIDYSFASVNKDNGIFVFTDSEPIQPYTVLGRVKCAISWTSGQYTAIRNQLVKKAVKEYPDADGVILYFNDGGVDRGVVIKFNR